MRLLTCAVAAGVLALPLAARADLLGDSVNVSIAYPSASNNFADLGNYTVPGTGVANTLATFVLNSSSITIISQSSQTFRVSSFNGLEFTDLTKNPYISAVTVDSASTFKGAGISFTSNEVFANFSGATVAQGDTLILDLTFTPPTTPSSVTPEPTSIALLGTGLLGVAGTMRRKLFCS